MTQSYFQSDFSGSKRERTAEGFLLCRDVRVARTGQMLYADGETPLPAGNNGIVKVDRDADVLFNPITLESGLGKSVTIQHPEEDVDPNNWKEYEVGTSLNCRRGDGAESDYMLMDLMIKDSYAIEQIESGLVEISLGYDALYHKGEKPGTGYQTNILINHVALVDKGRCGAMCAIRDSKTIFKNKEVKHMAKTTMPRKFKQLLRDAFRTTDSDEFEEILGEAENEFEKNAEETEDTGPISRRKLVELNKLYESGKLGYDDYKTQAKQLLMSKDEDMEEKNVKFDDDAIQEHIDKNEADHNDFRRRLSALEQMAGLNDQAEDENSDLDEFIEDEAPEGVEAEEIKVTKDSRYLIDSLRATIAMAEIIAPGISMPTVDRAASKVKTASSICALRKKALRIASTNDCAAIVDELTNGKALNTAKMTCDAARTLFNAIAIAKRNENRSSSIRVKDHLEAPSDGIMRQPTIREINEANRAKWSKK